MGEPKYESEAQAAGSEATPETSAPSTLTSSTPAEEQATQSAEPVQQERRSQVGGQRDRRMITRLHAPELRNSVRSIQSICSVWVWASIIYVLTTVSHQVYIDFNNTPKSIFYGVVILTLSFAAFRISRAAKSYLENESQARLEKLIEGFKFLVFTAATASLILGSAYLLTLF